MSSKKSEALKQISALPTFNGGLAVGLAVGTWVILERKVLSGDLMFGKNRILVKSPFQMKIWNKNLYSNAFWKYASKQVLHTGNGR